MRFWLSRYKIKRFPFVTQDIFLTAWIDKKTGKQKLIMEKIDAKTEEAIIHDEIDCIHTAICDIPIEDFTYLKNRADSNELLHFEQNIIHMRSSENLKEINLSIKEKFKALVSWVAGIAEAGLDAFQIQAEIDNSIHLIYQISNKLMHFMIRAYPDFIPDFLEYVEKNCYHQGILHDSCLIANLIPILEVLCINKEDKGLTQISDEDYIYNEEYGKLFLKNYENIIDTIFDMRPPVDLFLKNPEFQVFLNFPGAERVRDIERNSVKINGKYYFVTYGRYGKSLILEHMNIESIDDIEGLNRLGDLKYLSLWRNRISEIKGLECLKELEVLSLADNRIKEIKGLDELINLRILKLSGNRIKKIQNLNNLKNLSELSLWDNEIDEIYGLDGLTNLKTLILHTNHIKEIKNLFHLKKLYKLDLYNNEITEIKELHHNPRLFKLDLYKNPLNEDCFSVRRLRISLIKEYCRIKDEEDEREKERFLSYYH